MTSQAQPRVSVVVASYNRAARAQRLLEALAVQVGTEPFEVVVADDASTDDTVDRLTALAPKLPYPLEVLPAERNAGPGNARNRAWRKSRGELVVFIDDDVVPEPTWLSTMVAGFDEGDIIIGRTRPPDDQLHLIGPFAHYLDMGHNGRYSTCNIAYRRSILEELDGFDEVTFTALNGEDTDLGLRARAAGHRDVYREDALVWHDVRSDGFVDHVRSLVRLEGIPALFSVHPEARAVVMPHGGYFLRTRDKAVLIGWFALLVLVLRGRAPGSWLLAGAAAVLYQRKFAKHVPTRSHRERITAAPLGFVADSVAVVILLRASARYRTLVL